MNRFKRIIAVLGILVFTLPLRSFASLAVDLDQIVITAGRFEQPQYKLVGNVTILSRDQIEASNARTVPDILKLVQGVNVYDFNTSKSAKVDIRGFGDSASQNVLVLVNGRRVNSIDLSGTDLIQIPLDAVDRIEIIRGAGSVLYGDNAVGGVINIITKKGQGDLSVSLGGTYGSYDAQSAENQVSGEYKGLSYYMYSQYFDKRGYRENSDELLKDYNTRIAYDYHNKVGIDFEVGRHEDSIALPGGLDDTELDRLGHRGSADPADGITTMDQYYKVTMDLSPWFRENYWGDFVVEYSLRDRNTFDSFGAFNFNTDRKTNQQGVTTKYLFDHLVFNRDVHFVTGMDYYDTAQDILGSGTNTDDVTIGRKDMAFFGFSEFEFFENLLANGGVRYQTADFRFDNRSARTFATDDVNRFVSMGGLKYEYAKGSNIHLEAQQTFRLLATDEFYSTFSGVLNTGLEHQRGIQFEGGIKHDFADKVVVSVTPYLIKDTHEIFFDPTTFSNSNYPKTRRLGVEFGSTVDLLEFLKVDFLNGLELFANYTWQKPEFDDGPNKGKIIPLTAQHQANLGVNVKFLKYFSTSLTSRYVGPQFEINDVSNTNVKIKPYNTLDAKVGFAHKNLEMFMEINNLTDRLYIPVIAQSAFDPTKRDHYPAPQQEFVFGVKFKY